MTDAMTYFAVPGWVRLIPVADLGTAERHLVDLLVDSPDQTRAQARLAEFESAASDVVEGAAEHGIWLLGLATPPGRPAALLSVTGFRMPLGRHGSTELLSHLEDQGGPGIDGLRLVPLDYGRTAVVLHRVDRSGSQGQAFVPDAEGDGCFVFTLAAPEPDRGPELLDLVREIVAAATA